MDKDWHRKGLQLKQKGQYRKAIQAFNRAIDNKIKFAEAYFERGVCFYKLGNNRQASNDLAAAALLGCKAAELWSKYDRNKFKKSDEDSES
ncbi:MAG: tetratricopeptide repeat protein [Deltaproteobacteria bacterium]|nr:tetratricopeptide repeat protein [Deltaproteobacteria bacterium]MBW2488790.1 tetratricopeptide repeat protein [Deltaproteobacteria bacterium]MBW2518422.1 tetratricopeptide repeat protein [Deltaproteobacteria bacterium]